MVTATRVPTPITAIPNTVRVLGRETVESQLAVSPSLLDSLSFSVPSLAPGRQRLTSAGESLRGRTPLYMVDAFRRRRRCATAREAASPSIPPSSIGWR